jgi:hypothetical protein
MRLSAAFFMMYCISGRIKQKILLGRNKNIIIGCVITQGLSNPLQRRVRMKNIMIIILCGLLAGCEYTVPVVKKPAIDIDRAIVGLWQRPAKDGKIEHLLVVPLDKQEYLVSYPSNSDEAMFARACLGRVKDITLVQLKWFATAQAALPDDNKVYQFASYSVSGDKLTVRMLNSDVISKDVASTDALIKAIAANKAATNLFRESMVFTRIKPEKE